MKLTNKELKLQTTIKQRFDGELPRYRSVDAPPVAVELSMTDVAAWSVDCARLRAVNDPTMTKDDLRTSGERQQRTEDALLTSTGENWWAKLTPSGFGPVALAELGSEDTVAYDGTEVITTIEPVDPDDVRVDAGFVKAGSFADNPKVDGVYRDFVRSARLFAADDEQADLWTEEGYAWESLDDDELAVSGPSFEAYWE